MKEKNDNVEQLITDKFKKEVEEIEKDLKQEPLVSLPADLKAKMKLHIDQEIQRYEKNKVYAQLSEEDRKALEIGQEMLKKKDEQETKEEPTIMRKKKTWRLYVGLAAVLVMVMAVGVTSIGGPERIVEMLTKKVGDREVSQVDSGRNKVTSVDEKEEEAYQQIKDELGIEPVRMLVRPKELKFERLECDSLQQVAEIIYTYKGYSMILFISTLYSDASWGIDIEDKDNTNWEETVKGCVINIKEYEEPRTEEKRYSAEFEYLGVKYFLNATMEKEKFNYIIKNLYFIKN